ncbi:glycoside hydrolase family 30 protein [Bifidobacterium favimelis]|uniref:Glycosyl hydrolase family 30 n=1 Tax=Bifidobacterium favimelis TaxID=3122979 RepID=A0ABU8ZLM5_9BIFI
MVHLFENQYWTVTSGDLSCRRDPLDPPEPVDRPSQGAVPLVIDPTDRRQAWLGAGAAVTDAAASLIWGVQDQDQRHDLLDDMFNPSRAGFSMIRIPLGSCEPSSQPYYTYDDIPYGGHDRGLEHFSLGEGEPGAPDATRDLKYIVPVVQEILSINPGVKVLASPWTAPAWMKNTGRLCQGGHLRFGEWTGNGYDPIEDSFEGAYARYFERYIDEMADLGIPIWGVTVQNEPSNAAPWPAMMWTLDQQADFAHRFLRPVLDRRHPQVRIFINDDSARCIPDPIGPAVDGGRAASIDGVAIHTYDDSYRRIAPVVRAHPEWAYGMTERRCLLDEEPEDASHIMSGVIGNWLVRQGVGFITLWNLALDERGLPNQIGADGRRGVVTIDHESGRVRRNLEYFMLRAFGQDVEPGSLVIGSGNHTPDGWSGSLGSVAFLAPDGAISAHIYNPTGHPLKAAVTVNGWGPRWQEAVVPAWGTVTMHCSHREINRSQVPADGDFELKPIGRRLTDDRAPGR